MPSEDFISGEFRIILAVLFIVVIGSILVFGNVSPSGLVAGQGTPKSDRRAPELQVGHSPAYPTNLVTIGATASDNKKDDTGLKEVKIYLDNVLVKTCSTSPCQYTLSNPKEGQHAYYATATDNAGNSKREPSAQKTRKFAVDATSPTVSAVLTDKQTKGYRWSYIGLNTSASDSVSLGKVTTYFRNASNNKVMSNTCDFSGQRSGKCGLLVYMNADAAADKGTHGYWGDAYDKQGNYARDPPTGEKSIVWP